LSEHSVIAHLKLSDPGLGIGEEVGSFHDLSDELIEAIEQAGAGEFDGDEFGKGECVLYMYGPDADALFAAVEPVLRRSPLAHGGHVIKRYGAANESGAKEVVIKL
jgi:hypothetical protein